jgi:hypothetical protein
MIPRLLTDRGAKTVMMETAAWQFIRTIDEAPIEIAGYGQEKDGSNIRLSKCCFVNVS